MNTGRGRYGRWPRNVHWMMVVWLLVIVSNAAGYEPSIESITVSALVYNQYAPLSDDVNARYAARDFAAETALEALIIAKFSASDYADVITTGFSLNPDVKIRVEAHKINSLYAASAVIYSDQFLWDFEQGLHIAPANLQGIDTIAAMIYRQFNSFLQSMINQDQK
jgi:hypothetical protein